MKKKAAASVSADAASSTAVVPSDAAASSSASLVLANAAEPSSDPSSAADAALVGQLVRVTDDILGFGVAGELVEILSIAGSQMLGRVQKAGASKVGRNVSLKRSQLTLKADLPAPVPLKKLRLSQDDRVELDVQFDAKELGASSSIKKDSRLASMHMNMLWWITKRHLELAGKTEICFLEPEFTAQTCYEMKLPANAGSVSEGPYLRSQSMQKLK